MLKSIWRRVDVGEMQFSGYNSRGMAKATAVAGLSLLLAAGGLGLLMAHERAPGGGSVREVSRVAHWAGKRGSVVVYAHPKCPCVKTTLANLGELGAWGEDGVSLTVHFVRPEGAGADWMTGDAVDLARWIEGAHVDEISEGEARAAGVKTSGHVVVIDGEGRMVMEGGVTFGRGHAGANAGLDEVVALRAGRMKGGVVAHVPVYGCPLMDEREAPTVEETSACCADGAARRSEP